MSIAFLRILNPDKIKFNMDEIKANLKRIDFEKTMPYKKYTPKGYEHRFVVWRFNNKDVIPDKEGKKLVGKKGNILYVWKCPRCKLVVRKCEHPGNHKEDCYLGCSCSGWGFPVA